MVCKKHFTLKNRKHHCRQCGLVICNPCSMNRAPIPSKGYDDAVRVCDACVEGIKVAGGDVPKWMHDAIVSNCMDCAKEFNVLFNVRRHHCRVCGRIFCSQCCGSFCQLNHVGVVSTTPVRVCDQCVEKHSLRVQHPPVSVWSPARIAEKAAQPDNVADCSLEETFSVGSASSCTTMPESPERVSRTLSPPSSPSSPHVNKSNSNQHGAGSPSGSKSPRRRTLSTSSADSPLRLKQHYDPDAVNKIRGRWIKLLTANTDPQKLRRLLGSPSDTNGKLAMATAMSRDAIGARSLVRHGGVPPDLRGMVWPILAASERESHLLDYEHLLKHNSSDEKHNSSDALREIEKDLHRTLPEDPYFNPSKNADGIAKLKRVLAAYSWRNPDVGYCQSMNKICAVLLLFVPEEEAFWVLSRIVEHYLCGYYSDHMVPLHVDMRVLQELVKLLLPKLDAHLASLQVDLALATLHWFLCAFVDVLKPDSLFRVWDLFFVEGRSVLFRASMGIFKMAEKDLLNAHTPADAVIALQHHCMTMDADALVKSMYTLRWGRAMSDASLDKMRKHAQTALHSTLSEIDSNLQVKTGEPLVVPEGGGGVGVGGEWQNHRSLSYMVEHWVPPNLQEDHVAHATPPTTHYHRPTPPTTSPPAPSRVTAIGDWWNTSQSSGSPLDLDPKLPSSPRTTSVSQAMQEAMATALVDDLSDELAAKSLREPPPITYPLATLM